MTELESKCLSFIKKHLAIISYSILLLMILGLYVQMGLHFDITSPPQTDFTQFIQSWWSQIVSDGGFRSLSHQIGDYAASYQTLLAWMTTWGLNCQGAIKLVGAITNFALAFAVAAFTYKVKSEKTLSSFALPFLITLILPSVFIESMIWGQCDPLYALFMFISFYFIYNDKWGWGLFFYGVSLSFKLEPIMFLPFIIMIYVLEHKHSIFNFGWTLLGFYIPNIGGLLHGQSFFAPFNALLGQTSEQPVLSLNAINLPQLFAMCNGKGKTGPNDASLAYNMMSSFLILMTIFIFAIVLIYLVKNNYDFRKNFVQLLTWCIWTCEIFLPSMHERYDFMVGILLLVLTCLNVRYLPMLALVGIMDTVLYLNYFFYFNYMGNNLQLFSWIMLILYGIMTYIVIKQPSKFEVNKKARN